MLQTFVNAALEGEIDHHLKDQSIKTDNRRNGHTHKTVRSSAGPLEVQHSRYGPFILQL